MIIAIDPGLKIVTICKRSKEFGQIFEKAYYEKIGLYLKSLRGQISFAIIEDQFSLTMKAVAFYIKGYLEAIGITCIMIQPASWKTILGKDFIPYKKTDKKNKELYLKEIEKVTGILFKDDHEADTYCMTAYAEKCATNPQGTVQTRIYYEIKKIIADSKDRTEKEKIS